MLVTVADAKADEDDWQLHVEGVDVVRQDTKTERGMFTEQCWIGWDG